MVECGDFFMKNGDGQVTLFMHFTDIYRTKIRDKSAENGALKGNCIEPFWGYCSSTTLQ